MSIPFTMWKQNFERGNYIKIFFKHVFFFNWFSKKDWNTQQIQHKCFGDAWNLHIFFLFSFVFIYLQINTPTENFIKSKEKKKVHNLMLSLHTPDTKPHTQKRILYQTSGRHRHRLSGNYFVFIFLILAESQQ